MLLRLRVYSTQLIISFSTAILLRLLIIFMYSFVPTRGTCTMEFLDSGPRRGAVACASACTAAFLSDHDAL